jgi:hypothetical protein
MNLFGEQVMFSKEGTRGIPPTRNKKGVLGGISSKKPNFIKLIF